MSVLQLEEYESRNNAVVFYVNVSIKFISENLQKR